MEVEKEDHVPQQSLEPELEKDKEEEMVIDLDATNTAVSEVVLEEEEECIGEEDPITQETLDANVMCKVNLSAFNTKCCITDCQSNKKLSSKTTFVTFPKDPSRFAEWSRAIKRPDLSMNDNKRSNLLICSNHFSKSMWVNGDTRLKKLHKSAVPEIDDVYIDIPDEEELTVISSRLYKPGPKSKRGGIKVKKPTSLLSASALKESMPASARTIAPKSVNISPSLKFASSPVSRKQFTPTTAQEKKLVSENAQLKSELDKNMDYILNQKSHYETLLRKEKDKSDNLHSALKSLEVQHNKLTKNLENQIVTQKSRALKAETASKEANENLRKHRVSSQDFEKKYCEAQATIASLRAANDSLISRVNEMADSSPPPPPENMLQGENFKLFLNSYLKEHRSLKEKMAAMAQELEDKNTSEGQKDLLLQLASSHLNHGQLAWLEAQLGDQVAFESPPEHYKEFCLSLYNVSEEAYKVCAKAFGLAPLWCVNAWAKDPLTDFASVNSLINSLFEESRPVSKGLNIITNVLRETDISDVIEQNGRSFTGRGRNRKDGNKRRKMDSDSETDEDRDEGRLSDEDEELCYSSDGSEDMKSPLKNTTNGRASEKTLHHQDNSFMTKRTEPPASTSAPGPSQAQTDFDFMLEEASPQMGSSMPILVPDSPMVPLSGMSSGHNRKKMPDHSSIPSTSGSKVIFRVVDS